MKSEHVPNLGELAGAGARRDAVHVAVAPVVAAHALPPGYRVGLDATGQAADVGPTKAIGIVDPFLTRWVAPGERFWLFLFPGTAASLRHDWEHPAFAVPAPVPAPAEEDFSDDDEDDLCRC